MSRNFELLQQTSSVQDLFETSGHPAGLVGTAECEPRPTWSENPELFETADHPAGLVGTAECEPRPTWSEKPGLFETADHPRAWWARQNANRALGGRRSLSRKR